MLKRKSSSHTISFLLIFSMVLSFFAAPVSQYASAAEETFQNVIISEYIEGGSYNKAIELYNGTGSSVDLSAYTLETYTNGVAPPKYSLTLNGTLADGEVYVLSHDNANQAILDQADTTNQTVVNFNGNDPIVLKKNGTIVDSFGQIGNDADFAKDVTLVRNDSIKSGDTDPNDTFDASAEWTSHAKDTTTYLGSHLSNGGTDPEPVELSSIADARSKAVGSAVKVKGIATASFIAGSSTNLYIQDDTAGIIVRAEGIKANPGDEITVEGNLSDFKGMAQISTTSSNITITTQDAGIPQPQTIQSTNLTSDNGEAVEGEYVQLENVTIKSEAGYGEFNATDSSGEFKIDNPNADNLEVGKTYEILRGVINYDYGEYKLVFRSASDIVENAFSVVANPGAGSVTEGTKVTLETATEGANIHYTMDGSTPTDQSTMYSTPITLTKDATIKAIASKDGRTSEVATFSYTVLKPADNVKIHDIQGAGHESPYKGKPVSNVEGIVTAKAGANGFYMQSETPDESLATSEGIFVYSKGNSVKVGDKVSVDGKVAEWREDGYDDAKDLLTTQISASNVTVVSSDQKVPAATVIGIDRTPPTETIEDDGMTSFDPETDGLDFYESLEGMLIEIPDAIISGPKKYDEVPVFVNTSDDQLRTRADGLLISPEDFNPERMLIDVDGIDVTVKTGDQFDGSILGNVSYDYSNFKIRPTGTFPSVVDGGVERETTEIEVSEEKLTVATYNIENFRAPQNDKAEKIAESIVSNMKTPDIIGLVEVQDNNGPTDDGTTDASESYKALIKAIESAGGPTYEFAEVAPLDKTDGGQPGGNIRVGFIYNPDRVDFSDKPAGDATTSVGVDKDGLTHNPGRIDPTNEAFDDSRKALAGEFTFNGEKVIVIANHFNSKGGDGGLFGSEHPVVLGSEVQRMKQAAVINDFVTSAVDTMEDANVIVLGDLNDFEFSDPINTLEGDVLTNMMEKLSPEERYTYIYQGNSQVLDHILVTNNLAKHTAIDSININSDFSEADGRASDHDPVLAQIQFGKKADRTSGKDRYKTAIEVSKEGWEQSDTVVIARGDTYPDALAGAPLAYKYDAPILLNPENKLNADVRAELDRLSAKKVIILGGKGAISNYVEYQIEGLGIKAERISGKDRFETAANIAARLDGNPAKAVIADGYNYPDALAVASHAAKQGYPILLTGKKELPTATKTALRYIDETIVVGGTGAISEDVFNELPNPKRYSGSDRYSTAATIATDLVGETNKAFITTGSEFADALTGSVLAAKEDAVMLLVQKDNVPTATQSAIDELDIKNFRILGGTGAVSEDVINQLIN
ncbi:cell wall-binding repeat-containing protein [Guptibacillus algicola]|uniref:cell wall-binding repeat-containing protein n=1 Tax=Guptibacillus algicola TaxID=225844 RepID=UPI001CD49213|nr:cell wall-binding repeat-containing protein [Alkalihalobacillus algicola]MCA0987102.1 cell wall-binding repeat-containing protein [Alkalihalobacillus algicola]